MFRKVLITGALALGLSACTTTGGITPPTAAQIQNAAVIACGFLPTATTVAGIISASPVVQSASTIAALICEAVTASRSAKARGVRRGSTPTVNGVVIHGRFVR